MKKAILFIILVIVFLLSLRFFIAEDNDFSGKEINAVIANYYNEGFISLKDENILNYISEYYDVDEIIEFEILHNDNSCVALFFLSYDVSKEIIEDCNEIFTKYILLTSDPIGGPVIINSQLRKKLNLKNLKVYIGDSLAMDYNFHQKNYSIIDSQIIEDFEHIYDQRKINDELSNCINMELKKEGYKNIIIEKSFNNAFLIVKIKGNSINKAQEFFLSNEFVKKLEESKHDFINEIRVILTSDNNNITTISLEK